MDGGGVGGCPSPQSNGSCIVTGLIAEHFTDKVGVRPEDVFERFILYTNT